MKNKKEIEREKKERNIYVLLNSFTFLMSCTQKNDQRMDFSMFKKSQIKETTIMSKSMLKRNFLFPNVLLQRIFF